jgi:hypothetical protein
MPRPSRISEETWKEIRLKWEAHHKEGDLAREYDIPRSSIYNRSKTECWMKVPKSEVEIKTIQALSGVPAKIPAEVLPEERERAIQAEAELRALVIKRHRGSMEQFDFIKEKLFALLRANPCPIDDPVRLVEIYEKLITAQAKRNNDERRSYGLNFDPNAEAPSVQEHEKKAELIDTILETMSQIHQRRT